MIFWWPFAVIGLNFLKGIDIFSPISYYYATYDNIGGLVPSSPVYVKGFKVGTSYDFTMSKFKAAGPGTGGLEISLIYVGRPKNTDLRNIMFCPRF